jgi:hypothetical protein
MLQSLEYQLSIVAASPPRRIALLYGRNSIENFTDSMFVLMEEYNARL